MDLPAKKKKADIVFLLEKNCIEDIYKDVLETLPKKLHQTAKSNAYNIR